MSTLLSIPAPIPERIVRVTESEGFAVRGLNPLQAVAIYRRHAGTLEPMFAKIMAGVKANGGSVNAGEVQPLLLTMMQEVPQLLGELIAVGSGGDPADLADVTIVHPGTREPATLPRFDAAVLIAQHLPFPVQADALSKIGELTFTEDMPPGKFVALVVALLRNLTGGIQHLTSLAQQQNGSGESAAP